MYIRGTAAAEQAGDKVRDVQRREGGYTGLRM